VREFVFDLVYEETAGPLQQLCTDTTGASSRGVGGSIDAEEFWRLEQFEGPADALSELTNAGGSYLLSNRSPPPAVRVRFTERC